MVGTHADFAPTLGTLKSLRPFVFWAQTTLPTVFDDSLSYYEVLTKLCKMVNTLLENEDTNAENIQLLSEAFQELQDFTNDYFDNLDISEEIDNKINELIDSGDFDQFILDACEGAINEYLYGEDGESGKNKEIDDLLEDLTAALGNFNRTSGEALQNFSTNSQNLLRDAGQDFNAAVNTAIETTIPNTVESWLDQHFYNPNNVVIDATLTLDGAAADAKATGDAIDSVNNVALANRIYANYITEVDDVKYLRALDNGTGAEISSYAVGVNHEMYIANVTEGEGYLITCVAFPANASYFCPAYAFAEKTIDLQDNVVYNIYDIYPRTWDRDDQNIIVRNRSVIVPAGCNCIILMNDLGLNITASCKQLANQVDSTLTSPILGAQAKATGDELAKKIPWPVSNDSVETGNVGDIIGSDGNGGSAFLKYGGLIANEYDEEYNYSTGDYCVYNNKLYICLGSTTGDFDASDWRETKVTDELENSSPIPVYSNAESSVYINVVGVRKNTTSQYYTYLTGKKPSANGFVDDSRDTVMIPNKGYKSVTLPGNYSVFSTDSDGRVLATWVVSETIENSYVRTLNTDVESDYICIYTTSSTATRYYKLCTDKIAIAYVSTADAEPTVDFETDYTFNYGEIDKEETELNFVNGIIGSTGVVATSQTSCRAVNVVIKKGTVINTQNTPINLSIHGRCYNKSINITYADYSVNKEYVFEDDFVGSIMYEVGEWKVQAGAPNLTNKQCAYFLRVYKKYLNKWQGKIWYSYGTSITDVGVGDTAGNAGTRGKWPLCVDALSKMARVNGAIGSGGIMPSQGHGGNVKNAIMQTPFDCDLVTIEAGPNDDYWTALGNVGDTGDNTFLGNLYQCFDYLTKNTRAVVVFVAIGARQFNMNTTTIVDANGLWRSRYRNMVKAVKELAELFGISVIDADANACNLNRRIDGVVMADYIHYTYLGGEMYGRYVWDEISRMNPYPIFANPD